MKTTSYRNRKTYARIADDYSLTVGHAIGCAVRCGEPFMLGYFQAERRMLHHKGDLRIKPYTKGYLLGIKRHPLIHVS